MYCARPVPVFAAVLRSSNRFKVSDNRGPVREDQLGREPLALLHPGSHFGILARCARAWNTCKLSCLAHGRKYRRRSLVLGCWILLITFWKEASKCAEVCASSVTVTCGSSSYGLRSNRITTFMESNPNGQVDVILLSGYRYFAVNTNFGEILNMQRFVLTFIFAELLYQLFWQRTKFLA